MKSYRIILYFLFCFLAGFLFTSIVYLGYYESVKIGFSELKWWAYIIILIVSFYLTLTIHELAHFISFKLSGVKLKAIYLTIFIFHKTDKGWRFTVDPNLWVLFGGLVVPDLDLIEDDNMYEHTISAFRKSLITAPITTIVFALLQFFSFFFVLMYSSSPLFIAIYATSTVIIGFLSFIYIRSFSISTQNIFGDFVAYNKIDRDLSFQLAQIIQYQRFSLEEPLFNPFLFHKVSLVISKQKSFKQNLFNVMLLSYYLEGVNYYGQDYDESVEETIRNVYPRNLRRDEAGLMCAYELAIYKYIRGDVDKAYHHYQQIQKMKYKQVDDKLLTYEKNRFEHITHVEYHNDFLSDINHVYSDQYWVFNKILDIYKDIAYKHKQLPFITYESIVHMRDDELDRDMI